MKKSKQGRMRITLTAKQAKVLLSSTKEGYAFGRKLEGLVKLRSLMSGDIVEVYAPKSMGGQVLAWHVK